MKIKLIVLLPFIALLSCQDDVISEQINKNEEAHLSSSHAITVEQALASLSSYFSEGNSETSRGIKMPLVADIYSVKSHRFAKSRTNADFEDIVYVANFANEQGYAILAADDRISEKVIAVTEDGSMDPQIMRSASGNPNEEDEDIRQIFDNYPSTGPGFFTVPECGDEVFMNPNTVSLYDASEDDTLIGNFDDEDDEGAEDENGNPISSNSSFSGIMGFTAGLCLDYAINEINGSNGDGGSSDDDDDDPSGGDPWVPGSGGVWDPKDPNRTEVIYNSWTNISSVSPLFTKYVSWGQHEPFNNLYPKRRKYLIFGNRRKAPAGCFPLALAKIMTYFKYPASFTYNGTTVNWNDLNTNAYTTGANSAAALLRGISNACSSIYFYAGTFTFPKNVTSYMRNIGISNSHSKGYNFSLVTEMLDRSCPLIIYSIPNINIFKAHAWNLDGYKVRSREVTIRKFQDNTLKETSTKQETSKMVHCDFGWKGQGNGYYVSGIFKVNNSSAELDGGRYKDNTNFNHLLKVITYDK